MISNYFKIIRGVCLASLSFVLFQCDKPAQEPTHTDFEEVEQRLLAQIDSTLFYIDAVAQASDRADLEQNFVKAKNAFKSMEPILSFIDVNNYNTLNGPNILKVEEEDLTNIKIIEPKGFQVLEETIFTDEIDQKAIEKNTTFVDARLNLIKQNLFFDRYKPYHFLWMMRNSFIRTATLGITGFDSPMLARSLEESKVVYKSLEDYLTIFKNHFTSEELLNKWQAEFEATQADLNGDFDTFDRFAFIKNHTHKQMQLWKETVADWGIEFPFELAVTNEAENLFSNNTFNLVHFSSRYALKMDEPAVALGKKLFYDKNLSGDNSMSCATCHQVALAFTDGKQLAEGKNTEVLKRNTPTLLYAGFQKGFSYDRRVGNLDGQITGVVSDKNEFHTDLKTLEETVKQDSLYRSEFGRLFKDSVTQSNIRQAIATYIRSLAPFDSKFDRNIRGEEATLKSEELLGFNLFMGKAACATCHFPPLFNGTVPPNYTESEMEALGVPETAANQQLDDDLGRYDFFHTDERKFFFKTPTVRNIEYTAPYMHNGVYDSLEQVMDFYNVGGGQGMGFDLEYQTLPPDSLHLTDEETQAIIAFMKTLSDPMGVNY